MANTELRSKFGYFTYADMLAKLQTNKLNAYDVIYCKDKNIQYIITPDLVPVSIGSNIDVYDSVSSALTAIKSKSSTYAGQLVSIFTEGAYRVYIVNVDEDNEFILVPSQDSLGNISYKNIKDIPITIVEGTSNSPINLYELNNGYYKVLGYYKILSNSTQTSAGIGIMVFKEQDNIKIITTDSITDYKYTNNIAIKNSYITDGLLDSKLIQSELNMKKYIDDYVFTDIARVEAKVPNVETVDINFNIF